MSRSPARRSADLQRLRDEGYTLSLVGGSLVVSDIPFVDHARKVRRGTLVAPLAMAGDVTVPPTSHAIHWAGGRPYDDSGRYVSGMTARPTNGIFGGVRVDHVLCHMPKGREYVDYHEMITAYANLLGRYARLIEPDCSARTAAGVLEDRNVASPFNYLDTATERAGVHALSRRLEGMSVGIVGLGGTGSYVLDLVAKTPVSAIHLFDDDSFDQHNAFRAPGAIGVDELRVRRKKVDHFTAVYSAMHRGIIPHACRLARRDLRRLEGLDFVFVCIDDATDRGSIADRLDNLGIPFIDTGIGLEVTDKGVMGLVRITTSTADTRGEARDSMPTASPSEADAYRTNAQIAEINAVAAALAVIRWKRLFGFYCDTSRCHSSVYVIDADRLHGSTGISVSDEKRP